MRQPVRYLAFDIEIAKEVPEEGDWKAHRPLGITCAGLYGIDWQRPKAVAEPDPAGGFRVMSRETCSRLVDMLLGYRQEGYQIIGWNSLSFDFDILAEESGRWADCRDLALNHSDLMFQIFCKKGFPLGLDRVAKGMGLAGKPEGMDGAKAPVLWAAGEYQKVLDYVRQDVRTTMEICELARKIGRIRWQTRSGKIATIAIPDWAPVRECMAWPEPYTGWMDDPWPRSRFLAWMADASEPAEDGEVDLWQ